MLQRLACCGAVDSKQMPRLVFSPLAWLKLQFFLHAGETQTSGFGLSLKEDSLYVGEFVTPMQYTAYASTQVYTGVSLRSPQKFQAADGSRCIPRIWCITHPAASPEPNPADQASFEQISAGCDWSVLVILAQGGLSYARMCFAHPKLNLPLEVAVDWASWPAVLQELEEGQLADLAEQWMNEYGQNIIPHPQPVSSKARRIIERPWDEDRSYELPGLELEQRELLGSLTCAQDASWRR